MPRAFFQRLRAQPALLFTPLLCWFFYSGLPVLGHLDLGEHASYFKDLAAAFLRGQLDVALPPNGDLVDFNSKIYLYWPPVPALLYLPLVALFGLHLPDAILNSLFGALNVYLLMRTMQALAARFEIPLRPLDVTALGLFWGLGTVHFYMSMPGTVWFVSQIIGQTMLLASALLFLEASSRAGIFASGLFFGLACYTRNDLVFSAPFFVCVSIAKSGPRSAAAFLREALLFGAPFVVFSLLNLEYNRARFGSVFDNGIRYHQMSEHFRGAYEQYGYLSVHYLPHNIYTELFHWPQLQLRWPPIAFEPEGFGLLWVSPLFLLLGFAIAVWVKSGRAPGTPGALASRDALVMTGAWLSTLGIAAVILLVMGTGWMQFGARYTLDFHLFLLVQLAFLYKAAGPRLAQLRASGAALIAVSIFINYCGAQIFFWN